MKIRLKWLLSLLSIMVFLLSGLSVNAINGGGIGSGDGSSVGGTVDPNASSTGFSKNRTGYLFYIADSAGNVKTPVTFVPYNQGLDNRVVVSYLRTRVSEVGYSEEYTGNIAILTDGGFTKPPCTVDGGMSLIFQMCVRK